MAFSTILNLFFYFSIFFSSTFSITNITSDQSALLQFKNNIIDPRGFLEDWNAKKTICNWTGVTCNPVHLRVKTLDISNMALTGTIHPQFGNLSFLIFVNMSNNELFGILPVELARLRRLRTLDLSYNIFTGSLPPNIFNLTNLVDVRMRNNSIEGEIPQDIGNLKKLRFLDLQYNKISGLIPRSIYNMSSLEILALSFNNLSGNIPSDLCHHLQRLRGILLGGNQFYGGIPASLPECSKVEVLSLAFNKLTGSIPNYIGNLTVLQTFQLQGNNLSGTLPEDIGNLKKLELLTLYNNSFSGVVPASISNCSQLLRINFYNNQFINSAPNSYTGDSTLTELNLISYIANFRQLQFIDISENPLHGFLPKSFSNFSASFDKFSAENCELSGIIPDEIGNLSGLIHLDFGGNNFNGKIPSGIKGLVNLQRLYLDRNILSGSIPLSICNLPILGFLELSSNKISGEIPECVGSISSFRYLGLYNNLLEGNIPLSLWGLKDLLALSLAWNKLNGSLSDDLSTSNLLGKGSFGSVYKGVMNNGTVIAVKVFNLQVQGAFKSFDVECEVLRNLRHRNLTKVITSCSDGDSFKALVLEYMSNGSLDEWLHSGRGFLNMLQRLNIMIDVAHAIEYLHYGFSSSIVHCDIKPSNVLLDETMTGRLSDFGLTRFLNDEASFTHTTTLATFGYIAPEYGIQGLVSRACDVYSFGILLMETFTKRKPSDEMFTGNLSLREWIYNCFHQKQFSKILDTNLLGFYESKVNEEIEIMSTIMGVALSCCEESVNDRMNMKDVCIALEKIKLSLYSLGIN